MIDEARARVEFMRGVDFDMCVEFPLAAHSIIRIAADLIESISAELEQVKQERDGLSITLTTAESAAETYKRERDAAVEDLKDRCYTGKAMCNYCILLKNGQFCAKECDDGECFEWRGVKEDT